MSSRWGWGITREGTRLWGHLYLELLQRSGQDLPEPLEDTGIPVLMGSCQISATSGVAKVLQSVL